MDPSYIQCIENELKQLVTPYTAPEVIKEIQQIQGLLNDYKTNPSNENMTKLMLCLNQFIRW